MKRVLLKTLGFVKFAVILPFVLLTGIFAAISEILRCAFDMLGDVIKNKIE